MNKEVRDLSFEYIDIAISVANDSDLLDKVPVLGTFNKLYNIRKRFKEKCFEEELKEFLTQIETIKLEDRIRFQERIEQSTEYKNLAERILIVLDGFNEVGKATIVGKLFKALILEKITMQQFKKSMFIIDNCFLDDLIQFKEYYSFERRSMSAEAQQSMLQSGLLDIKPVDVARQRLKNKRARREDNYYDVNFKQYKTTIIGQVILNNGF